MIRRFINWLLSLRGTTVRTAPPEPVQAEPTQPKQNPARSGRQRPRRSTLRRRTGGWSGAIAMRGRVS